MGRYHGNSRDEHQTNARHIVTTPESNANSRPVISNQTGLHPRLAETVAKHLEHPFRRPVAEHSLRAYETLASKRAGDPRPLLLDTFCGTGQSTAILAQEYPELLAVGVDQSAHRIEKHRVDPSLDYLLLRANVEDIWQLLLGDNATVARHYLLYPNPWPKRKHLQRRIHGHGSFQWLLQLGGAVELRSNWPLYVEEFGVAMHLAGRRGVVSQIEAQEPLTLFEQKYRDSGHSLWCFRAAAP